MTVPVVRTPNDILKEISRAVTVPSAKALALTLTDLIRSGHVMPGDRLPTVRSVAIALDVSAPTVASAWADLRHQGILDTRRRGGTFVMPFRDRPMLLPRAARSKTRWLDLAFGIADPALLPPLEEGLMAGLAISQLHEPQKDHAVATLIDAVSATIPFRPEAWSTASNGSEATLLVLSALATRGNLVAIEQPSSPRLMDILQTLGLEVVPVSCDEEGPTPVSLRSALARSPSVFIYQPRGQIPLGHSVSGERAHALAEVLQDFPGVTAIEDDNIGPLSTNELRSIGEHLPDRVTIIRTYCRAYGMDLRCSVFAGPRALIRKAQAQRSHGAAMNSRILQGALAHLIADGNTSRLIKRAAGVYHHRREELARHLHALGLATSNRDGVFLWVPVVSERAAVAELARHNIGVAVGSACSVSRGERDHIRVSITLLPDEPGVIAEIAELIFDAAQLSDPESLI